MIQDFDCDFHTPSPPQQGATATYYMNLALFVHLAQIGGDIHRSLYTPEAARSSTRTYLQNVERCEGELEQWRHSYLGTFPASGIFQDENEIPGDAFADGQRAGVWPSITTYMYLMCTVRRAMPVVHTLPDGTKIAGMDQKAVEVAMAFIRILQLDKRFIDSCFWYADVFHSF
jgi:hypothetical protein